MKFKNLLACCVSAMMLASCSAPKDIVYFQDVKQGNEFSAIAASQITIQPWDQLRIIVSTSDERLTNQFNLSMGRTGSSTMMGSNNRSGIGYTVNSNGNIDFPVLGEISVVGLTREQVAKKIKDLLIENNYVRDPVVVVQYMNLSVAVLGSVRSPGRVDIDKDRITILDAIAESGDLTINGQRQNVKVIRNIGDNKQEVYTIDLTDAENVYKSPVYYLQQDDVIYVAPNEKEQRGATVNGNTLLTYGFWMSAVSFLMSVAVFIKR